jgi:hypothetical protein
MPLLPVLILEYFTAFLAVPEMPATTNLPAVAGLPEIP